MKKISNKSSAFENYATEYDQWFDQHPSIYKSELEAVRSLLPAGGAGLEVGVGSGRFAEPLGIKMGVEPSIQMRQRAMQRNIEVFAGVAEALPFQEGLFDYVVFVTTTCFLKSLLQAFTEAHRVLKDTGIVLIGMVDRYSPLGDEYEKRKNASRFYQQATFHSVQEVVDNLEQAGFSDFKFVQTLFKPLNEITQCEPVKEGYGEGAFVVIQGVKR